MAVLVTRGGTGVSQPFQAPALTAPWSSSAFPGPFRTECDNRSHPASPRVLPIPDWSPESHLSLHSALHSHPFEWTPSSARTLLLTYQVSPGWREEGNTERLTCVGSPRSSGAGLEFEFRPRCHKWGLELAFLCPTGTQPPLR